MKNPNAPTPTARLTKHGEKMIEIRIRFWTDALATKGSVIPKHAWDSGVVSMKANKSHGIAPATPKPFNSISELSSKVAEVLTDHDITLHASPKTKKLIKP